MSKPETVSVGGQAVIEGVMMRSTTGWAVAARTPEGGIVAPKHELPRLSSRSILAKIPFIRGVLVLGSRCTSHNAECRAWNYCVLCTIH